MIQPVLPEGGLLCHRCVSGGQAWVGVFHLPPEFVPVEGVLYGMRLGKDQVTLSPQPLGHPLDEYDQFCGIGDLMRRPIWAGTPDPTELTVRFLSALPQENTWSVYGISRHPLPDDAPNHSWFAVHAQGRLAFQDAPFDATGEAVGSLLSSYPVWPSRTGTLYSFPQLQSSLRPHYHEYHQLLAQAARDPAVDATLENTIASNPQFRQLSLGRVDREYCQYLAKLQDAGLLAPPAPRTQQELDAEHAVLRDLMSPAQTSPSPPSSSRSRP
jgi:hypothetical protein